MTKKEMEGDKTVPADMLNGIAGYRHGGSSSLKPRTWKLILL